MTLESLKKSRPEIAISIEWEVDEYYSWDGDGPDPENDGYSPYYVTVTASTIRHGKLFQGRDVLGGCYSRDGGKDDPDVSGCLSQMLDAAVENSLQAALSGVS